MEKRNEATLNTSRCEKKRRKTHLREDNCNSGSSSSLDEKILEEYKHKFELLRARD
jgi:hypothetical protein